MYVLHVLCWGIRYNYRYCYKVEFYISVLCQDTDQFTLYLLLSGTDVSALDQSGNSPFHLARSRLRLLHTDPETSSMQYKEHVSQVWSLYNLMGLVQCHNLRCSHDPLYIAFHSKISVSCTWPD